MSIKQASKSDTSVTDLENGQESPPEKPPGPNTDQPEAASEFTRPACLTLIGAFFIMFCSVGFINAFGIFQQTYQSTFLSHKTASDISWIGSFQIFIMFGGTLPIGYLSDRHGPRLPILAGSIIMIFAMFMLSLSRQYYQIFLAQGLLLGIGISLVVLPAFATVPRFFVKNRSLANGISVSGSSLGGIFWPLVFRNLFKKVGFGWAVRIAGFIMLPLLLFGVLFVKLPASQVLSIGAPKPKPNLGIFKNPILLLLGVGLCVIYLGLFSPFFYITSWTVSLGLDADMAFYMVSIMNAASLLGRIGPGVMADHLGAFNVMAASAMFSGIVCTCWTKATSMVGLVILALGYGFVSGAVISLQGVCAARTVKPQDFGMAIGLVFAMLSIAGLIGSPINGLVLDRWGFKGLSLFSGLALLIGASVIGVARSKLDTKLLAKA